MRSVGLGPLWRQKIERASERVAGRVADFHPFAGGAAGASTSARPISSTVAADRIHVLSAWSARMRRVGMRTRERRKLMGAVDRRGLSR